MMLPRRALVLGGLTAMAGCSVGEDLGSPDPGSARRPFRRSPPSGAPEPPPTLAPYAPWQPDTGEVQPQAKVAAARAVESLGSELGRLTRVVYPQYGGLLPDRACVMVLARQEWVSDGALRGRDVTVDVRLDRRAGAWQVDALRVYSRRGRGASDDSPPLLRARGLEVPGAAAADLDAGRVAPELRRLLRTLGREHGLSVSVFASGHPYEVFGSGGPSNHAFGRAVDIWAIDGRPVVSMAPDDPTLLRVLRRARELGSDEVGGPVDPDGPGGVHFANALHRDHVHIGFEG
jgi:hypothetical protein